MKKTSIEAKQIEDEDLGGKSQTCQSFGVDGIARQIFFQSEINAEY